MLINDKLISVSKRTRLTPFTRRVEAAGVKAYMVYNHMLLPTLFNTKEDDYWHLCEHVQVWDVSCERQVEISGPDADRLVQLMTPRDLRNIDLLQGKYAPICDENGLLINDPIIIKIAEDRWWISIADSDVKLFAKGLAIGLGLDVNVFEPEVYPLAVQGPKANELVARIFGEETRDIGFFRGKMLPFQGEDIYVARSGWSKQGGFEIYLHEPALAEPLWDALFELGADLNVGPGSPHGVERVEGGLLSYGADMNESHTPLDCGLDAYLDFNADIDSLSLPTLRAMRGKQRQQLVGLIFSEPVDLTPVANLAGGFDVFDGANPIGEISSQVWSFRYRKHLAIAMLDKNFADENDSCWVAGCNASIVPFPFSKQALESD